MSIFSSSKSFADMDELIHSGIREINLENDFKLNTGIFSKEKYGIHGGIKLDIDDLTIDGHGHVIDGNGKTQIFNITAKNIRLKNIVFKNAQSNENDAAIYTEIGSEVEITDCRFINSDSPIKTPLFNRGNMRIKNTSFTNSRLKNSGSLSLENINYDNCKIDNDYGRIYSSEDLSIITSNYKGEVHIQNAENEFDFNYLNELIHTGIEEIKLTHDISPNVLDGEIMLDIDNVSIDGCGHTIDGLNKTRIFEITGKNITLKNIIFKNANSSDDGGVIRNKGEVEICNCNFLENQSRSNGGVIYNTGILKLKGGKISNNTGNNGGAISNNGRMTINGTEIKENKAEYRGGAVYNVGELKVIETNLSNNISQYEGGGAIFNNGEAEIILTGFTANRVEGDLRNDRLTLNGGAIFNNEGHMKLDDCQLCGNLSGRYGGAIYNRSALDLIATTISDSPKAVLNDGELIIIESTLTNNSGYAIDNNGKMKIAQDSKVINNHAEGSIINNHGNMAFTDSTITKNHSRIYGTMRNGKTLELTNTVFSENSIGDSFYGIFENSGLAKINSCQILKNKCPNRILINSNTLEISNTEFKANDVELIIDNEDKLNIFNGIFVENYTEKSLISNKGSCAIAKTKFENNHLQKRNYKEIYNNSQLSLANPQFKNPNKSIYNNSNGEIILKNPHSDLKDKICGPGKVKGNVRLEESLDFTYLDDKIHDGKTKEIKLENDILFESYEIDFYEGGIELDIDDLVIDGNGATIDGDGKTRIFIVTGKNITLKNITFKNGFCFEDYFNSNNSLGGSILINPNTELKLENCSFIDNLSQEAVYNKSMNVKFEKCTFEKNKKSIYNSAIGQIHAEKCMFSLNEDVCISNYGEMEIVKTSFSDNLLHCISNSNQMRIIENTLSDNNTPIINDNEMEIVKTIFSNNRFHCIDNKSSLRLFDCDFCKNENDGLGGAAISNDGNLEIKRGTFSENTTKGEGGAIYNKRNATITDATFASNRANGEWGGGAIFNYNGIVSLTRCTFENNMSPDGKPISDYNTHASGAIAGINITDCSIK